MPIIIGINAFHADSSAAIFKDGELLFAIEEEKLVRQKHWAGFPEEAIKKCLEHANIEASMVADVSINSNPISNLNKKIPYFLKNYLFGNKKKKFLQGSKINLILKNIL